MFYQQIAYQKIIGLIKKSRKLLPHDPRFTLMGRKYAQEDILTTKTTLQRGNSMHHDENIKKL